MRTSLITLRISLLVLVVFSAASGQQRGNITGQVVLPSGQPVNNRIKITLSGYRISSSTTYTDNKGRFTFSNVSDGTYSLEVEGDSRFYDAASQEVRVIYGSHPGLIITLKEKA